MSSSLCAKVKFKELLIEPVRNGIYKQKEFHGRGCKIVNMGELFGYSRIFDAPMKRVELNDKEKAKSLVQVGDLLFARRSLTAEGAGKCSIVKEVKEPTTFESSIIRARPNSKIASSDFLYYYFSSPLGREQVGTILRQVAVSGITGSDLMELELALPTLEHQISVASFLSAIDDRIALLRETNATLEAIAQTLFKSWFVDFDPVRAKQQGRPPESLDPATAALFPDDFEDTELGPVPKGWRVGTLGEIAAFQNGYAFKSKDWSDSGHPVVKIGDVKPGIIDFSGCTYVTPETTIGLNRFKLNRGDLLVGMTGYVGEVGLVPHVEPAAYLNQRVGRMGTQNGLADLGFIYCITRNPTFKKFAEAQSHGSAQANVSGTALMEFPTLIPNEEILCKFNGILSTLLEQIISSHEHAQTLATLRDTLLPRLISGQLRLPETVEVTHA